MKYQIHPSDLSRILFALDERKDRNSARIARDLREQFEQNLLPVTREVREPPVLRVIQGGGE